MKNTMPPLLLQFVMPAFKLSNDTYNAAGLFNGSRFNPRGVVGTQV